MENEINSHTQLDELQEKYDILKRKFDAQQIVNHDLVHQVAQTKMDKMQRKLRSGMIVAAVIAAYSIIWIAFKMDCSPAFCLATLFFWIFIFSSWLVKYRKVLRKTTTTADLLDAAQSYKASFNMSWIYKIITIPLSTMYVVWAVLEMSHTTLAEFSWSSIDPPFLAGIAAGLIAGLVSSVREKTRVTTECDEIIKSLSQEE